jgi:transglutaminase-like putative cysteine protease
MHRFAVLLSLALLGCGPRSTVAPKKDRPVRSGPPPLAETWHAAYFEGVKAGYVHTAVYSLKRDGAKLLRTVRNMHLRIKRYDSVVPFRVEVTSEEKAADGTVVALSMTQILDGGERRQEMAQVEDERTVLYTGSNGRQRLLPWDSRAIGMYEQERIYQKRKVKPGGRLSFVDYQLPLLSPYTLHAAVKEPEKVDLLTTRTRDGKARVVRVPRRLLRVELTADKLKVDGRSIELPMQVAWLDSDLLPVRYDWAFPGLGRITLYQTTREAAQEEGVAPALLPDLGLNTIVAVKKVIDHPYDTRLADYRVRVTDVDDPASAFARDDRQQVSAVRGNTFDLHVRAEPDRGGHQPQPNKKYLQSSYFLDSADPAVRLQAGVLTEGLSDPWRKAQAIERWVHEQMRPSNAIGFATASQVLRERRGDCRQHAMLTAALCRAAGVPARTAIGLIYVREPKRGPSLIFHMWTEVYAEGQWRGLDATLGKGRVSACHLKIVEHSWSDTRTLAPLLPVARVMGKVQVEVLDAR